MYMFVGMFVGMYLDQIIAFGFMMNIDTSYLKLRNNKLLFWFLKGIR